MHFEDFKTWHWMLIGLIAGALFSGVKLWTGPWYANDDLTLMDQLRFERGLTGEPAGGPSRFIKRTALVRKDEPILKDLVVHPPLPDSPDKAYWVTGKVCEVDQARQNEKE